MLNPIPSNSNSTGTSRQSVSLRWQVMMTIPLAVLLMAALAAYCVDPFTPGFNPKKYGRVDYNETYCITDGVKLEMDIYYPSTGGPWPVLVFMHGGGWFEGDKSSVDSGPTAIGYLVVSINYRMYPDYRFPAMIMDVKCAIRSLRANADEYNLDPARIALMGHSAGAHLAALAGAADKSANWDVGQYLEQSSRVQAVLVLAGPADLTSNYPEGVFNLFDYVFGPEQLVSGSPITYVSPDDPPYFILHGDADYTVPVEQATILRDALGGVGVPVELVIMHNGGHGFESVGGATSPTSDEAFRKSYEFLDRYLGNKR